MDGEPPTSSKRVCVNKSAVHKEFKEISWKCPKTNQVMKGQKCLVEGCGVQIAGCRSTNMKTHLSSHHHEIYQRVIGT